MERAIFVLICCSGILKNLKSEFVKNAAILVQIKQKFWKKNAIPI